MYEPLRRDYSLVAIAAVTVAIDCAISSAAVQFTYSELFGLSHIVLLPIWWAVGQSHIVTRSICAPAATVVLVLGFCAPFFWSHHFVAPWDSWSWLKFFFHAPGGTVALLTVPLYIILIVVVVLGRWRFGLEVVRETTDERELARRRLSIRQMLASVALVATAIGYAKVLMPYPNWAVAFPVQMLHHLTAGDGYAINVWRNALSLSAVVVTLVPSVMSRRFRPVHCLAIGCAIVVPALLGPLVLYDVLPAPSSVTLLWIAGEMFGNVVFAICMVPMLIALRRGGYRVLFTSSQTRDAGNRIDRWNCRENNRAVPRIGRRGIR